MPIKVKRNNRKNAYSENLNAEREKAKSSTQTKGESPVSPVSPAKSGETLNRIPGKSGDSGESGETPPNSVDDSNKSQTAEKLLTTEKIESKDGRRVIIEVYDIGQYKEIIAGDKIIRERQLKFIIRYKDKVEECVGHECKDAVKKIAKATHYSPSTKEIMSVINDLREQYETTEEISIVDYVRQKYGKQLAELEKDPFAWILSRTREIVGYDRLKILTFLSVVSSQMQRVMGMSRLHILLTGKSGAGKSSTIKSVLRYVNDDTIIAGTRLTQNSLGYLQIDTFDGRVLFIEQIDRQTINYLREMMSEDKVCTLVTEKVADEKGEHYESRLKCIPGQASVISTSVADTIDVDREQIFNRFLKVYVNPETNDFNAVVSTILTRQTSEISEVDRLVFTAYLMSRPKFADINNVVDEAKNFVLSLQEFTREPLTRVAEVLRNLIIAVAIARGKTKADKSDFDFVMQNFQLDVLYNGLGLTEIDVEIIKLLPDNDSMKTSEIADALRVSKQYAINTLKNLERKGVIEGEKADGKTFDWSLTGLGRKIKALLSEVIVVKDEKGEIIGIADSKFRPDVDGRGDKTDAVSGDDGMSGGDGKNDRVTEAYKFLKANGNISVAELTEIFGDDIIEKLKKKDLVTFNIVDGVEYVYPK